jgi:hypothetical protein
MSEDIIKQHMENGTAESRALFDRFIEILDDIGPYTIHPAKSTITCKGTRRGFCGAHPKKGQLVGYFDLMHAIESDPRKRSVSPYTKKRSVHQFRITDLEEMDETLQGWIQEAYRVGQGEHLK